MFRRIFDGVAERFQIHVLNYLPSLLVAIAVVAAAYLTASAARWVLNRIFKGFAIDRFLRQSGVAFLIDSRGRLRATRLVSESVYWSLLGGGFLLGLSVFDTDFTNRIISGFVALLPKLLVAGLILLAGRWLSVRLGRSVVVWAVGENLPGPRQIGTAVRVAVMFVAVVVAADHLDFARTVFLAAFVLLVGGAVLALSLAVGIGGATRVSQSLSAKRTLAERVDEFEAALWSRQG